MYHIGEVIEVFGKSKNIFGSDKTTQVLLNMWDENILTLLIEESLVSKVKNGDVVLVDYRPISAQNNSPRMIVVKILKGDVGRKAWRTYKVRLEELKGKRDKQNQVQMPQRMQQPPPTYIG